MRITGAAAVGAAAGVLALATLAQAQDYHVSIRPLRPPDGFARLHVSKAALGSTPIRVWANAAINPDCTAMTPGATLSVRTPPSHGTVTVDDQPLYMAYPPANPRSACNSRKVPGHEAVYTAAAGFTGHDKLVLQGSSPDGRVREVDVDVDVR